MASSGLLPTQALLLFPVSCLAEFWNIDCGASEGHVDNRGLTWERDVGYVHLGESHKLSNAERWPTTMHTLMSFPERKKNCYSIPVGEGTKIVVLLDFLYGNYDGLEHPPVFSCLCEDIVLANLPLDMEMDHYWSVNFIYVTRHSNASICFGRENDAHDPIVNAIKVVALDPGMYPLVNSSVVLGVKRKVAFGTNSTIAYPNDPYDRRWIPSSDGREGFNYTILASNGTVVDTSSAIDKPPLKMFSMAASGPEGETNLTIRVSYLSGYDIYFNMYFSEVSDLAGSQEKRSFHIYLNDRLLTDLSNPIVPPFNDVLEISEVVVAAPADAKFILVPTDDSTLPPIISGLETFVVISNMIGDGTYGSDGNVAVRMTITYLALQ